VIGWPASKYGWPARAAAHELGAFGRSGCRVVRVSSANLPPLDYEVLIVGGGVAGLSGALLLGRCGRRVLVCDDGHPRNSVARGVHGFLTRDGIPPPDFLRAAREQVLAYPTVSWCPEHVTDIARTPGGFRAKLAGGRSVSGAKLLLATGLVDELPPIEGIHQFWGSSVFVCPLCDAWEVRGQPFTVIGRGCEVYEFTLELRQWSREVTVCTDGAAPLEEGKRAHLERLGVRVIDQRIVALDGHDGQVEQLRFADGSAWPVRVIFVTTTQRQRCSLAENLGCCIDAEGTVTAVDGSGEALRNVWVAGNSSKGLQLAIVAAAEGAKAAHAINECLVEDQLRGT
jgi:thioredoxin reductase